jgi:hypothetical protein
MATRATARVSAAAFSIWLVARGVAHRRGSPTPWFSRTFAGFVTVHTIHFSMVLAWAYAWFAAPLLRGGVNPAAGPSSHRPS